MCYSEMWKSPFKGAVCPIPPPPQSESFLFFKWENKDVNWIPHFLMNIKILILLIILGKTISKHSTEASETSGRVM